jgi:hypothetical protein
VQERVGGLAAGLAAVGFAVAAAILAIVVPPSGGPVLGPQSVHTGAVGTARGFTGGSDLEGQPAAAAVHHTSLAAVNQAVPTTTTTVPAPSPAQSFVQQPDTSGVPPPGEATAYGCAAAESYINAYAAPGFSVECPAYSGGHQATTWCVTTTSPCNLERRITIAEPCPDAYMNEASNSWVVMGASDTPIDPYGQCS